MKSEQLNAACFCISLEPEELRRALEAALGSPELVALIDERCPHLFSARPIFTSATQTEQMAAVVSAVESVVAMPSYREFILANAPAIARHHPGGASGVFFGYDFHLHEDRCGVIEINTNAGGAMLNAVMARAHHACCLNDDRIMLAEAAANRFEDDIVAMFRNEWQLANTGRALTTIAIVDTAPCDQYLYPEFLLFQRLFERHGLQAVIADPSELQMRDNVLMYGQTRIDMVYNRLTDFMLEQPDSAAVRDAYLANAIVLTPHPQAHALYANKRNLAVLCDDQRLQQLGVPSDLRAVLTQHVLPTQVVDLANAEHLWAQRRHLFFKPAAGYGGKAAYRGDKLTKKVWQEILASDYIAQAYLVPGARVAGSRDHPESFKFDIRAYAYAGQVQWHAARMYQGQTTNFRTPGGGFAPVYSLDDAAPLTVDMAACCVKNCT
jgi:hypothetical protein